MGKCRCGDEAQYRRTTSEFICAECRKKPDKQLVSVALAAKKTGLPRELFDEVVVGSCANPIDVRFRRCKLVLAADALEIAREYGGNLTLWGLHTLPCKKN